MNEVTTIKLSREIRERLNKLKEHERETFNEVINKLLYVLNVLKKNPEKAQKILRNIDIRIKKRDLLKKRMKNESS